MISLKVRTNFERIIRELGGLPEELGNKAAARALNATVEQGKIEMAREISQTYRLTVAQVKERLTVRKAVSRGTLYLTATLEASQRDFGRSMNLIAFLERSITLAQSRKRMKAGEGGSYALRNGAVVKKALQLRFQIKRSGGQKMIPGAFVGNKGRTVFIREGKARLPIHGLNTIDVPQMFNARRINEVIRKVMIERFDINLRREVSSVLRGFLK